MGTILTKKEMTEEDIKLQFITPALTSRCPPISCLKIPGAFSFFAEK